MNGWVRYRVRGKVMIRLRLGMRGMGSGITTLDQKSPKANLKTGAKQHNQTPQA